MTAFHRVFSFPQDIRVQKRVLMRAKDNLQTPSSSHLLLKKSTHRIQQGLVRIACCVFHPGVTAACLVDYFFRF